VLGVSELRLGQAERVEAITFHTDTKCDGSRVSFLIRYRRPFVGWLLVSELVGSATGKSPLFRYRRKVFGG